MGEQMFPCVPLHSANYLKKKYLWVVLVSWWDRCMCLNEMRERERERDNDGMSGISREPLFVFPCVCVCA